MSLQNLGVRGRFVRRDFLSISPSYRKDDIGARLNRNRRWFYLRNNWNIQSQDSVDEARENCSYMLMSEEGLN